MLKVIITYTDQTTEEIEVDAPNQRDAHKVAKKHGDRTGKSVKQTEIKRGSKVLY